MCYCKAMKRKVYLAIGKGFQTKALNDYSKPSQ